VQEENNLAGSKPESDYADKLRQALKEVEAPHDQLTRLKLE
jgi:hypothetical protein